MNDAPKLSLVTLRKGTKFYAVLPDGTLSAERLLIEDIEAEVVDLGPVFNVYDTQDYLTIMVDHKNEVR